MAVPWEQRFQQLERQIDGLVANSKKLCEQSRRQCAESRRLHTQSRALIAEARATPKHWREQVKDN
jgi:hypothetical protein